VYVSICMCAYVCENDACVLMYVHMIMMYALITYDDDVCADVH